MSMDSFWSISEPDKWPYGEDEGLSLENQGEVLIPTKTLKENWKLKGDLVWTTALGQSYKYVPFIEENK